MDAELLKKWILKAAQECYAIGGEVDNYGSRYTIDFEMINGHRRATVKSAWIILVHEDFPRLVTCSVSSD